MILRRQKEISGQALFDLIRKLEADAANCYEVSIPAGGNGSENQTAYDKNFAAIYATIRQLKRTLGFRAFK